MLLLAPNPLIKSPKALFSVIKMSTSTIPSSQNAPRVQQDWPKPLSPPLPSISKQMELARAMSASSKSSLFKLSATDVLYEDEWLIAVNKPFGVYCESVLASAPSLLSDGLSEGRFSFHSLPGEI